MTPGMVLEDGDPSPLEILSKFHGQEGFYCDLSFPQHFTCPQHSHILQSHQEGDLGMTPKKGLRTKTQLELLVRSRRNFGSFLLHVRNMKYQSPSPRGLGHVGVISTGRAPLERPRRMGQAHPGSRHNQFSFIFKGHFVSREELE